jgi:hypothetical protein
MIDVCVCLFACARVCVLRAARALTLKRVVGASVLDNTRQSFRRAKKKNLLGQRTKKRESS